MPRWISTAQRTASTTLANSASMPVAGGLDDPSAVFGDLGIDEGAPMGLELDVRAFFVAAHQAAVTGDIGRENGGQPPFRVLCCHID